MLLFLILLFTAPLNKLMSIKFNILTRKEHLAMKLQPLELTELTAEDLIDHNERIKLLVKNKHKTALECWYRFITNFNN